MRYRLVRAHSDKPHRCPLCWKVAPKTNGGGRPRPISIYKCDECMVRWFRRPLIPGIGTR